MSGVGLAVVVCVHTTRRLPLIRRVLAVLAEQARPEDEVVVVADHNEELRAELAAGYPDVRIVANTGRRGLSDARNTGIAATTAPVLVFVDDDAVPRDGWMSSWRAVFADSAHMLAGGAVEADWERSRPRWFPAEYGWVVGCDYTGIAADGAVIRNPIGANMAVRRSALHEVGLFSTELGRVGGLPAGCEETELGVRVGRAFGALSVRRHVAPVVDHHVPVSRGSVRYFVSRCHHEGRSKAALSRIASGNVLGTERRYVVHTLGGGAVRHLGALLRGDLFGPARAFMLVAGFVATALGYVLGRLSGGPSLPPVPVVDLELAGTGDGPLPVPIGPASVLVRVRGLPVGRVEARQADVGSCVLAALTGDLAPALDRHLRRAGVEESADPVAAARRLTVVAPAPVDAELVSVVVCTLGRQAMLRETVAAILAQTHGPLDLVIVDNDPESGRTAALLSDVDDPRVRVVAEPVRGLSRARNTGLAAVRGALVAFTDDDAVPDVHWIAELVAGFARSEAIGCVTGLVTPADLSTRWAQLFEEYGAFDKGYRPLQWSLGQVPAIAEPGPRGPLFPYAGGDYGSGNNMAFRVPVLRAVGGFDTALGAGRPTRGGEDLDAFAAVLLAGHAVLYTPDALVRHHHRDTGPELRRQLYGYGTGMAAVVAKRLVSSPQVARRMLTAAPSALGVLLRPDSRKNRKRSRRFPIGLIAVELLGYLTGPVLLARSRLADRSR
ncbi:glycosyltransferase family 2 protein [Lentzea sp. NPDC058436]|uniref:glycosyltransferase family 2 protein n=1 Tax=Lentzea sp. NPDC058436 TaxID=3346499 RepID=UPI00365D9B42